MYSNLCKNTFSEMGDEEEDDEEGDEENAVNICLFTNSIFSRGKLKLIYDFSKYHLLKIVYSL